MIHPQKGYVPEGSYLTPFGKARVLAPGTDVTLVGISYMVVECIRAHSQLAKVGISAEVIDPVSLSPLDIDTIVKSVVKTGRLIVVDTAWTMCGASAEIIAQVTEHLQGKQDIRVRRMGFEPVPCPTTKKLENLFYPNAQRIASMAYSLAYNGKKQWMPVGEEAPEIMEFKGPF